MSILLVTTVISLILGETRHILADQMHLSAVYPEMDKTTPEVIAMHGYPVEIHTVTTDDGYILEMHRIPSRFHDKPPIYLQHGLLSSSMEYFMNYPNQSLGYIASDAGFDVWLGNFRGNVYSNKHVKYHSTDPEYWNFMGYSAINDTGIKIDYILNATGRKQLYYVGNSLGSASILAFLSNSPSYNSKVKYIIALSPVVNTRYMTGLFPMVCNYINTMGLPSAWQHQVPPNLQHLKKELVKMCLGKNAFLCKMVLAPLVGASSNNFNITRLPVYLNHLIGGTSYSVIQLVSQIVAKRSIIRDFDYGPQGNLRRYGQIETPDCDFRKVISPVFIFYSDGDFFSMPEDIQFICSSISNCQGSHLVEETKYSHFDFVWATNNKFLIHDKIVARLNEYEKLHTNSLSSSPVGIKQ